MFVSIDIKVYILFELCHILRTFSNIKRLLTKDVTCDGFKQLLAAFKSKQWFNDFNKRCRRAASYGIYIADDLPHKVATLCTHPCAITALILWG